MKRLGLAVFFALCGVLAAFACSQTTTLPTVDVAIAAASLRNGEQVLWTWDGDGGNEAGSIEVTSSTLSFGVEVTAPEGTWPVTFAALARRSIG